MQLSKKVRKENTTHKAPYGARSYIDANKSMRHALKLRAVKLAHQIIALICADHSGLVRILVTSCDQTMQTLARIKHYANNTL